MKKRFLMRPAAVLLCALLLLSCLGGCQQRPVSGQSSSGGGAAASSGASSGTGAPANEPGSGQSTPTQPSGGQNSPDQGQNGANPSDSDSQEATTPSGGSSQEATTPSGGSGQTAARPDEKTVVLSVFAKEAREMASDVIPELLKTVSSNTPVNELALAWREAAAGELTARVWSVSDSGTEGDASGALTVLQSLITSRHTSQGSVAVSAAASLQTMNGDNTYPCPWTVEGDRLYLAELSADGRTLGVLYALFGSNNVLVTGALPVLGEAALDLPGDWLRQYKMIWLEQTFAKQGDDPWEAVREAKEDGRITAAEADLFRNLEPELLDEGIQILEKITGEACVVPAWTDVFSGVLTEDEDVLKTLRNVSVPRTSLAELVSDMAAACAARADDSWLRQYFPYQNLMWNYCKRCSVFADELLATLYWEKEYPDMVLNGLFESQPELLEQIPDSLRRNYIGQLPIILSGRYLGATAQSCASIMRVSSSAGDLDGREGLYFLYYSDDPEALVCAALLVLRNGNGAWDLTLTPIFGDFGDYVLRAVRGDREAAEDIGRDLAWLAEGTEITLR